MKSPNVDRKVIDAARLTAAAEVIREHGWHNGCTYRKVCILQALAIVDGNSRYDWADVKPPIELVALCRERVGTRTYLRLDDIDYVYSYNDSYCRSGDGAIALLLEAAARCQTKEPQ